MAISRSLLTGGGSTTDGTTFTTSSITPSSNALLLCSVMWNPSSGVVAEPTITGNGLTWVLVNNTLNASNVRETAIYRAMGAAPTAGAMTITFPASVTSVTWSIVQYTGTDTSGTNGSGAIVQSTNGRPTGITSGSVSLASAPAAANETFALIGCALQQTLTPGTGWTQLDYQTQPSTAISATVMYSPPTGQQAITWSWATSTNAFVVGLEILAAAPPNTFSGTVALSGSGTVAPTAGTVTASGAVALSGVGTDIFSSALMSAAGTLGTSGSGTLTATGSAVYLGAVGLSGAGTLSATGVRTGVVGLSGAGALSFSGAKPTLKGTVGLTASGSLGLTGIQIVSGSVRFGTIGTLATSAGKPKFIGAVGLSSTGTLVLRRSVPVYQWNGTAWMPLSIVTWNGTWAPTTMKLY